MTNPPPDNTEHDTSNDYTGLIVGITSVVTVIFLFTNPDRAGYVLPVLVATLAILTGIAWLILRNPERQVAHHSHDELAFDVLTRRRSPERIELRLQRAEVAGAHRTWDVGLLPPRSIRGRLAAALVGHELWVEPDRIRRRCAAHEYDPSTVDAKLAEMVLLARCLADDDGPALAWLNAPHRWEIAVRFAELMLSQVADAPGATEVARRAEDSQSPRLRALANLHLRKWPVLREMLSGDHRLAPDVLDRVARAAAAASDPGAAACLVDVWMVSLPPATRQWLLDELARRGLLDSVLESGLAAQDERAVVLALNWHRSQVDAKALALRCVALLDPEGEGPPTVRTGDHRPALWIACVGRGGSTANLRLLRRWATAVDTEGNPADDTRMAADAAVLRLTATVPTGGGGLSVVGEDAMGGLAVAEGDALDPAGG